MAATEATILERPIQQEEEQGQVGGDGAVRGNFLLPDVLLAFAFAVLIDIFDVTLAIGPTLNLILGAPLIAWIVWKTKQIQGEKEAIEAARTQRQRVRRGPQERAEFRQRQRQILAARRAATRRAWRRGILFFAGGLIPLASIFVLWTWAVVSTVRGK